VVDRFTGDGVTVEGRRGSGDDWTAAGSEIPPRGTSQRTRSRSTRGLTRHVSELIASRELLANLTLRELRSRYKRSVLGWTWSLINPLSNVVIYSVVFSLFLKVQPPIGNPSGLKSFPLFLLCGLVPWTFFSTSLVTSTECLLSNGNLIKKVYFPRELLVMATVGSLVITMLIETGVLVVILILVGNGVLVWLPVVLALIAVQSVLVVGIGLLLSVLNVFFRDIRYLITILLNALFYASPIVYPIRYVPQHATVLGMRLPVRYIYNLNPLTRLIEAYRSALYDTRFPSVAALTVVIVAAVLALTLGWVVFGRLQRRVAEEV
jgi:ABC-type polysaccharide/polyol phosphate export permease